MTSQCKKCGETFENRGQLAAHSRYKHPKTPAEHPEQAPEMAPEMPQIENSDAAEQVAGPVVEPVAEQVAEPVAEPVAELSPPSPPPQASPQLQIPPMQQNGDADAQAAVALINNQVRNPAWHVGGQMPQRQMQPQQPVNPDQQYVTVGDLKEILLQLQQANAQQREKQWQQRNPTIETAITGATNVLSEYMKMRMMQKAQPSMWDEIGPDLFKTFWTQAVTAGGKAYGSGTYGMREVKKKGKTVLVGSDAAVPQDGVPELLIKVLSHQDRELKRLKANEQQRQEAAQMPEMPQQEPESQEVEHHE